MKWLASALIASVILPAALNAKGLDKLQPDTEEPNEEKDSKEKDDDTESRSKVDAVDGQKIPKASGEKALEEGAGKKALEKEKEKTKGHEAVKAEVKTPEVPVEPGFQIAYLGGSLSLISIKGKSGSWNAATTGDLEGGYRLIKAYQNRFDVYSTFRYRPADVTVTKDQRSYRGVVETYMFGLKGQMEIRPKLFGVASVELGRSKASLHAVDNIPEVDASLEKSGVDLSLGAGVSYLVLDKIALGTQLHLGLGSYQSTQFGVDLRFLF